MLKNIDLYKRIYIWYFNIYKGKFVIYRFFLKRELKCCFSNCI